MALFKSGDRLGGRFQLVRILGQGGMGEVWLARDEELDEALALKFLRPELASRPSLVELLKTECKRTRSLLHPNIVRLFDFHRAEGHFFLSMEYLDGGDIGRFRGAPPARVVALLMPVVDALVYAHGHGIIHRDLKLSNVLLNREGLVKLADFGISGLLDPDKPQSRSNGGGSPRTVSPQQLAGAPPDPRDDVYSLGILMRDMLTAKTFAAGPEDGASPHPPGVGSGLESLLESMSAPQAQQRPPDMERVRAELAAWMPPPDEHTRPPLENSRAVSVDVVRYPGPPPTPGPATAAVARASDGVRPPRNRKLLAVTSAAFVFLGLMAVGVFWYLPRMVQERGKAADEPSQPVAAPAVDRVASEASMATTGRGSAAADRRPPPTADSDTARLKRTRTRAEEALDALIARRSELEQQGVEAWGGETFEAAADLAEQGDQWFLAEDYQGALESYQAALGKLEELSARAPEVLTELLQEGAQALENGAAEAAADRYQLALRIEPDNADAAHGLEQARKLAQVQQIVADAAALEQQQRLEDAVQLYRQALEVDPDYAAAKDAVGRIEGALTERAYQQHMSRGLASLEEGNYEVARAAFDQAKRLRPEATAVNDALTRLRQAVRRQRIAALRARALNLERQQRWADAAEQYRAALAIDSTLVFAQQGAAKTGRWARLDARLDGFLAQPQRLYSDQPYRQAVELLHDLESAGQLPKGIESKTAKLAGIVDLAGQKITVSLISDLQTDVVVYRVGKLGRFERRDLQLRPGTYTVVGSCVGYRDVRHTVRVEPNRAVSPLVVRCEEKI